MCNRCSGRVHSKCSGLQNAAEYCRIKNWACSSCSSLPTPPIPQRLPSPITTKASDGTPSPFCNSNGSDSGIEAHLKFSDAKHPELHHIKKKTSSRPRRWFTHIDSQINKLLSEARFTRYFGRSSPNLEELTNTAKLGKTDLIITNVYIPPASSCTGGYNPSLDHLLMTTHTLILGDFNAHQSLWY